MLRSILAFTISLLAHVILLTGMSLPVYMSEEPAFIHVRIAEIPTQEQAVGIAEPERIGEPARIPEHVPQHPPQPLDETSDQSTEPVETMEDEGDAGLVDGGGDPQTAGGESVEGHGGNAAGEDGHPDDENLSQSTDVESADEVDEQAGPDLRAIMRDYSALVLGAISSHKVYPAVARRLGHEGDVRVRFSVAADGAISSVTVETSSGYPALDNAALEAVRAASPVPPVPPELGAGPLTLVLLIIFTLD